MTETPTKPSAATLVPAQASRRSRSHFYPNKAPVAHRTPNSPRVHQARHLRHVAPGRGVRETLFWTTIGTLIPGVGFLKAERWRVAVPLIALWLIGPTIAIITIAQGSALQLTTYLATNTNALLLLHGSLFIVGAYTMMVAIMTYLALRCHRWSYVQEFLGTFCIALLLVGIAVPVHLATQTVHAQRSMVQAVFKPPVGEDTIPELIPAAPDPWAKVDRVNILLVGSDAGAGRTGTRADSLIVASINPQSGDTVLISLPRNLRNPRFPKGTKLAKRWPRGYTESSDPHINAIWTWADRNSKYVPDSELPGLTATQRAVEGSLGIEIDHWLVVDMQGFVNVVDALGGLKMNVKKKIAIAKSDVARPKEWIQKGNQTLNGHQALWFGRSRWGSDDYGRMKRQRCVVGALSQQVKPQKLAGILPTLLKTAEENIMTSIPAKQIPAFVTLGDRVRSGQISSLAITPEVMNSQQPNYRKLRAMTKTAIDPDAVAKPTAAPTAPHQGTKTTPKATPSKSPKQVTDDLADVCSF